MKHCDISLPGAEENLACDEALLDYCEAGHAQEVLRFWEPAQYFVVVGYSNRIETEVNAAFCEQNRVPVLRRCTGGGTVLQGPGVLNYSLVLRIAQGSPLASISGTNHFILERHRAALGPLVGASIGHEGQTDLAIGGVKFSGNAQRRKQRCLLFHGSLLLHLKLGMVEQALRMPSRQPDYRAGRSHTDFLMNLKVPAHAVRRALLACWEAAEPLSEPPLAEVSRLAQEKYARPEWNYKF